MHKCLPGLSLTFPITKHPSENFTSIFRWTLSPIGRDRSVTSENVSNSYLYKLSGYINDDYQREGQRRQRHPTPVLLPGKSHGWRSLEGCSPWGRWGSDTTERLHFHFSLSCIGVGNGNPLQCSCLENPRDRGVWWAAVYGIAKSQTRLKQLSSSSSSTGKAIALAIWTFSWLKFIYKSLLPRMWASYIRMQVPWGQSIFF